MTVRCMNKATGTLRATLVAAGYALVGSSPASLVFNSDGWVYSETPSIPQYRWKTGIGAASDYEVRSTNPTVDGWTTDPSVGAWLNLGTTRTWERNAGIATMKQVDGTFEIRMASAPNTVLAGPTVISLTCDRT